MLVPLVRGWSVHVSALPDEPDMPDKAIAEEDETRFPNVSTCTVHVLGIYHESIDGIRDF